MGNVAVSFDEKILIRFLNDSTNLKWELDGKSNLPFSVPLVTELNLANSISTYKIHCTIFKGKIKIESHSSPQYIPSKVFKKYSKYPESLLNYILDLQKGPVVTPALFKGYYSIDKVIEFTGKLNSSTAKSIKLAIKEVLEKIKGYEKEFDEFIKKYASASSTDSANVINNIQEDMKDFLPEISGYGVKVDYTKKVVMCKTDKGDWSGNAKKGDINYYQDVFLSRFENWVKKQVWANWVKIGMKPTTDKKSGIFYIALKKK